MKEIGDAGSVLAGDAKILARLFVRDLSKSFGGFDREAVKVEILGEVSSLEEPGRLHAGFAPYRHDGKTDNIALARAIRLEKVCDGKAAADRLTRGAGAVGAAAGGFGVEEDKNVGS